MFELREYPNSFWMCSDRCFLLSVWKNVGSKHRWEGPNSHENYGSFDLTKIKKISKIVISS
jgi:hypothetical protein